MTSRPTAVIAPFDRRSATGPANLLANRPASRFATGPANGLASRSASRSSSWSANRPANRFANRFATGPLLLPLLTLLAVLLALGGCDGEGTTDPSAADFAIDVEVTDAGGAPVPDLRAGLAPALPESVVTVYPGWLAPPRGRDLPDPGHFQVTVRDVAGQLVFAQEMADQVFWPGTDQDGQPVHDGWYELELVAIDPDHPDQADTARTPVIVYSGADPDVYLAGVTDAAGSFTVTDRTMVPGFWDPDPIATHDEAGHPTGDPIVLTPRTWLRLIDPDGAEQWAEFTAEDGPQTVAVTWSPFRVDLQVNDPAGQPVPGLQVVVLPALPDWYWPEHAPGGQPTITFLVPEPATGHVEIRDVLRHPVRTLIHGWLAAGHHQVVWDRTDAEGESVPSGWYVAEIVLTDPDTGEELSREEKPLLVTDQAVETAVAETDASGRAVLVDRRLVPGFWDLPPLVWRDLDGEPLGEITLTPQTWIRLVDAESQAQWWSGELADAPQTVTITWDPSGAGGP